MTNTEKRTVHLCDCEGSCGNISVKSLDDSGAFPTKMHTRLCMNDLTSANTAPSNDLIGCTQEAERISDMIDDDSLTAVNIRDYAGWSDDPHAPQGKINALVQQALLPHPPVKTRDLTSDGVALVLGSGPVVEQVVTTLRDHLSVTWLVDNVDTIVMPPNGYDVIGGRLKHAKGAFTTFEITVDAFQERIPSGRGAVQWTAPIDNARSHCDLILDLRGQTPLFAAPHKRDGYFHIDPTLISDVMQQVTHASHMVGQFDKTLYIDLNAPLCAHKRAEKTACSRCLDLCPTGAITSAGEHVAIDPMICAGCGACAAACPSEAITYQAHPASFLMTRLTKLAQTYIEHEKTAPRLCVIDASHGTDVIAAMARYGRGLPHDVIPFELEALAQFGHAEILGAVGLGFIAIDILTSATSDHEAIAAQVNLAQAIAPQTPISVLRTDDPDALEEHVYQTQAQPLAREPILPMGGRRQITRMVAKTLNDADAILPLPQGAPYGAVVVDTDACTLCLSCVSLCPSGALVENEDRPELRFQEDACLQCGLCANVCPEKAITLEPRLNLAQSAMSAQTIKEEEPFACIECGALFGVKSTIERITDKLSQGHSMFGSDDKLKLIQMCDTCRVSAQYHSENSPFALGERPRPRTTEDYLKNRKH